MSKIELIIERAEDNTLWGRIDYEDNLIIESAETEVELESNMKELLKAYHELDPMKIKFAVLYDLESVFAAKDYLNVSEIARRAGISVALMQQYKAGLKYPSAERVKLIESVIRELGNELSRVNIISEKAVNVPIKKFDKIRVVGTFKAGKTGKAFKSKRKTT